MKLKFNKKILLKYTFSNKIIELYIGLGNDPFTDYYPLYIKTDIYLLKFKNRRFMFNDTQKYFISKN